jgi:hypothetical protein
MAHRRCQACGKSLLAGGMTFEHVQLEYDVSGDDIRADLKFLADFANRNPFIRCL